MFNPEDSIAKLKSILRPERAATPATMRALELRSLNGRPDALVVVEKPVPQPGPGEVLVRIAAAPLNPSDLMFLRGLYGVTKELPVVPGFEGSGVVVAAGPGLVGRALLGSRVACTSPDTGDGTWAEYMVTTARQCLPLLPETTDEQGAMLCVNPLTAWLLVDIVRRNDHTALIQTAAASAVGRMVCALARERGLKNIAVVRNPDQIPELEAAGADQVLVSTAQSYDADLKAALDEFRPTALLDAVGGEVAGRIFKGMPDGSEALVYGALSMQPIPVSPEQLIFEDKAVRGFWLSPLLVKLPRATLMRAGLEMQRFLSRNPEAQVHVQARMPLSESFEAIKIYKRNMTGGKVLFTPAIVERPQLTATDQRRSGGQHRPAVRPAGEPLPNDLRAGLAGAEAARE